MGRVISYISRMTILTVKEAAKETRAFQEAAQIVSRLKAAGHEAYFVGGCVRDILRGVEPEDYDIVTSAQPEDVSSLFPHTVPVGISFGVMLVVEEGYAVPDETAGTKTDTPLVETPMAVQVVPREVIEDRQ